MQTQIVKDVIDVARTTALAATFGVAVPDRLPPFWHHGFFWACYPPDQLGRDGHPKTGQGVIPDMGLPRRMWAGGALTFHAALDVGRDATKTTTLLSATRKDGRTGPLAVVKLQHEITQGERLCVTEVHDLIYREDPAPGATPATPPRARKDAHYKQARDFSTTLLFRYSALTFNGHRIHYDLDYAKDVEGYPGLIVHGPLLAQALIDVATDRLGPLKAFRFRATAPLFHFETATLSQNGADLWVAGPDGRQCMVAEATV